MFDLVLDVTLACSITSVALLATLVLLGWAVGRPHPTPVSVPGEEQREPWLWWHSNLNEKLGHREEPGKHRLGTMWRAGRAWLYLARNRYVLHAEWYFWRWTGLKVGVSFGGMGDDDILLSVCSPLLSLYLGAEFPYHSPLGRLLAHLLPADKECSIAVHHWTLWVNPWTSAHGDWSRRDPWWRRGVTLHLDDLLLGPTRHSEYDVEGPVGVLIPMPEGCYSGTARLFVSEWWRRWYWPVRRLGRVEIDVPGGVPHEGKGENSWDCGEDATYSITCPADSIEEGVGKLVASVLGSRRRYGGGILHRELSYVSAPAR